jgi:hypothetical protein
MHNEHGLTFKTYSIKKAEKIIKKFIKNIYVKYLFILVIKLRRNVEI